MGKKLIWQRIKNFFIIFVSILIITSFTTMKVFPNSKTSISQKVPNEKSVISNAIMGPGDTEVKYEEFEYVYSITEQEAMTVLGIVPANTFASLTKKPTKGIFKGKYDLHFEVQKWVFDDEKGEIEFEMDFILSSDTTASRNFTFTGFKNILDADRDIDTIISSDFANLWNLSGLNKQFADNIAKPNNGVIKGFAFTVDLWNPNRELGEIVFEVTYSYLGKTKSEVYKIDGFRLKADIENDINKITTQDFINHWNSIDKNKLPNENSQPPDGTLNSKFAFKVVEWNVFDDIGKIEFKAEITLDGITITRIYNIEGFLKTGDVIQELTNISLSDLLSKFNLAADNSKSPSTIPQPSNGTIKGIAFKINNWVQKDDIGEIDFEIELTKNGIVRTYNFNSTGWESKRLIQKDIDNFTNVDLANAWGIATNKSSLPSQIAIPNAITTASGIKIEVKQTTWTPKEDTGQISFTAIFTKNTVVKERNFTFYGFKTKLEVKNSLGAIAISEFIPLFNLSDKNKLPSQINKPTQSTGTLSSGVAYKVNWWFQNDNLGTIEFQIELTSKHGNIKIVNTYEVNGFKTNDQINSQLNAIHTSDLVQLWNLTINKNSLPSNISKPNNGTVKGVQFSIVNWEQFDDIGEIKFIIEFFINGKTFNKTYKIKNLLTTAELILQFDAISLASLLNSFDINPTYDATPSNFSKPVDGILNGINYSILEWTTKNDIGEIHFKIEFKKNGVTKVYNFVITGFESIIELLNQVTLQEILSAWKLTSNNTKLPSQQTIPNPAITANGVNVSVKPNSWKTKNDLGEISFTVILSKGLLESERNFDIGGYKTIKDVEDYLNTITDSMLITLFKLNDKNQLPSQLKEPAINFGVLASGVYFVIEKWITNDDAGTMQFQLKLELNGIEINKTFPVIGFKTTEQVSVIIDKITIQDFTTFWLLSVAKNNLPSQILKQADGTVKTIPFKILEWNYLDNVGEINLKVEFSLYGKKIIRIYKISGFLDTKTILQQFSNITLINILTWLSIHVNNSKLPTTITQPNDKIQKGINLKIKSWNPKNDIGEIHFRIEFSMNGFSREFNFIAPGFKSTHLDTIENLSTGKVMEALGIVDDKTRLPSDIQKPATSKIFTTKNGISISLKAGTWKSKNDLGEISFTAELTLGTKTIERNFVVYQFKTIQDIKNEFNALQFRDFQLLWKLDKGKLPSEISKPNATTIPIKNNIAFKIINWTQNDQEGLIIFQVELSKSGITKNRTFELHGFLNLESINNKIYDIDNDDLLITLGIDKQNKLPSQFTKISSRTIDGMPFTVTKWEANDELGQIEVILIFNLNNKQFEKTYLFKDLLSNDKIEEELNTLTFEQINKIWKISQNKSEFPTTVTSKLGNKGAVRTFNYEVISWKGKNDVGEIDFKVKLTKNGVSITKDFTIKNLESQIRIIKEIKGIDDKQLFNHWNLRIDKNIWPSDKQDHLKKLIGKKDKIKTLDLKVYSSKPNDETGEIIMEIGLSINGFEIKKEIIVEGFLSINSKKKILDKITKEKIISELKLPDKFVPSSISKPQNFNIDGFNINIKKWVPDDTNGKITVGVEIVFQNSKHQDKLTKSLTFVIANPKEDKPKSNTINIIFISLFSLVFILLIILTILFIKKNKKTK